MRIRRSLVPLFVLAAVVSGTAQNVPSPEIRRAIPVNPAEAAATPLPTAIPVMKAIPVHPLPLPAPTPSANSSLPAASTATSPRRVTTPIENRTENDEAGSIRLGPTSKPDPAAAAKAQLAIADGFYGRKDPAAAVPEYEKFLIMSPKDHPDREKALYRLGESQRVIGSTDAAMATFASILAASPGGPYHAGAAFRLGEIKAEAGNVAEAATNFAIAAKGTTDPSIQQAATYRQAQCLEKTGDQQGAKALFTSLLEPYFANSAGTNAPSGLSASRITATNSPTTNPYLIPTLLHLAASSTAAGNKEEALGYYTQALSGPAQGETKAEASLKSAALLSELGRQDEARKLFATVAVAKDAGSWRGIAILGLIRMDAATGDDEAVIRLSQDNSIISQENRPEILLLRADALRRKGRHSEALELYDMILREAPGSPAAAKAPFQRLLSLHAAHAPSLTTEIDQYLLTASDPSDRARAQLLKAEATLANKDYAGAAVLYAQIDASALPPTAKPDILYKQAWALLQAGNRDGGNKALSLFLESYPNEERAPAALSQLAMLKQDSKDLEGALADFTLLTQNYPKAPERELALQQKGLLLGQLHRNGEMSDVFALLLHDYPKSKAAAQANYWRGWADFEAKDYAKALPELTEARKLDPKQFGERAGLRILLGQYYLGDARAAAREASGLKPSLVPPEVGRWLGQKSLESGDNAGAERFLLPLAKDGLPGATDPEIQAMLASALTRQGKFKEGLMPAAASLKLARDPASRAKALLVSADIQRALKNFADAQSQIEEAMLLQPEGPVNAEARLLSGDILNTKQDFTGAAKAYMTVAYLSEDESTASKALVKAADAYHRGGNPLQEQKAREELRKRQSHAAVSPSPTP